MFSSLDRIDIVLKPNADGIHHVIQTDHRSVSEINQNPDLSTLFAITRILNPGRMVKPGDAERTVIYMAKELPPDFLIHAIHVAGGVLCIGETLQASSVTSQEPTDLEEVIATAFANLARSVAAEYKVELTLEGLKVVEDGIIKIAGDPEENQTEYWTAVVKLGTFAGEVIRASNGGQWKLNDSGTLPFALESLYRGQPATINPLGKAIKLFSNGEEDSLVTLVEAVLSTK